MQKNKTECKMTLRDEEPHVNKRFPRVRGDVPPWWCVFYHMDGFSPRARGCSGVMLMADKFAFVFPACAGMFPTRSHATAITLGFPRVRGDVPRADHHQQP